MTRPLNPARTITAPYSADHPPPMPERIRALLGKRAADLTRRELLDIAADAANRDPWDLFGDCEHVGAICDLAGTLEAELGEARDVVNALLEWEAVHVAVDALPDIDPMEPEAEGIGAIMIAAWQDVGSALQRLRPIQHPAGAPSSCRRCGTSTHACLSRPVIERCWDCRSCPCTCTVPSGALETSQDDFYADRLDICSCGHRRGDHEGAEPCPCMWSECTCKLFVLAESHDPRGRMPRRADEPGPHDAVTVDSALDDEPADRVKELENALHEALNGWISDIPGDDDNRDRLRKIADGARR